MHLRDKIHKKIMFSAMTQISTQMDLFVNKIQAFSNHTYDHSVLTADRTQKRQTIGGILWVDRGITFHSNHCITKSRMADTCPGQPNVVRCVRSMGLAPCSTVPRLRAHPWAGVKPCPLLTTGRHDWVGSSAGLNPSVSILALYFKKSLLLVKYLTHCAGQLDSNSFCSFSHEEAWSWLSSRHFHSSSLAPQHARLSLEFGAVIDASLL